MLRHRPFSQHLNATSLRRSAVTARHRWPVAVFVTERTFDHPAPETLGTVWAQLLHTVHLHGPLFIVQPGERSSKCDLSTRAMYKTSISDKFLECKGDKKRPGLCDVKPVFALVVVQRYFLNVPAIFQMFSLSPVWPLACVSRQTRLPCHLSLTSPLHSSLHSLSALSTSHPYPPTTCLPTSHFRHTLKTSFLSHSLFLHSVVCHLVHRSACVHSALLNPRNSIFRRFLQHVSVHLGWTSHTKVLHIVDDVRYSSGHSQSLHRRAPCV